MVFSSDSQVLHTDAGDIPLPSTLVAPLLSGQQEQSPNILAHGQWVLRNQ